MGVIGAAIATIIGTAVGELYCLSVLVKGKCNTSLSLKYSKHSKRI